MCELDAIVLGEGSPKFGWHGFEPSCKVCCNACGGSILLFSKVDESGGSLLHHKDVRFFISEHDEISFPVPGLPSGIDVKWSVCDRNTVFDVINAGWRFVPAPPPFELGFG